VGPPLLHPRGKALDVPIKIPPTKCCRRTARRSAARPAMGTRPKRRK